MKLSNIPILRLASQQLINAKFNTPQEIVSWMGAMQAQDFPMARWAIGTRQPGLTDPDIVASIDKAQIIRTHLLRPTWHFVAADDVYWLLDLTAPQIKASQRARDRQLELSGATYAKSNALIEKTFDHADQHTREELLAVLQKASIATDQNRSAHLLMQAELDQIICSGPIHKGKPTYALLAKRAPSIKRLTKEEALATLAVRYFTSRNPATLQDFTWWSGLPARDTKLALDLVRNDFLPEKIQESTYWIPNVSPVGKPDKKLAHLLPPYDEFIVSYSNRSAIIPGKYEIYMKEISDRGVFRPILVVDGRVAGIWKKTIQDERLIIDTQTFAKISRSIRSIIDEAAALYGIYSGKAVEVNLSN